MADHVLRYVPVWIGNGATGAGTGGITPGLPAGWQENDIFLMSVETDDQAVATPSGWSSIFSHAQGSATRLQLFGRRATASESAPSIADAGDHQLAVISAFRGCITTETAWVVGAGNNAVTSTATCLGLTTPVAQCLVVNYVAVPGNWTHSAWTNANLADLTERIDVPANVGNGGAIGMAAGEKVVAGATGNTTATITGGSGWAAGMVALKPLPGVDDRVAMADSFSRVSTSERSVADSKPLTDGVFPSINDGVRRTTQVPVQVIESPQNVPARATQVPVQVALEPHPPARATQIPVQVISRRTKRTVAIIWIDG